MISDQRIDAVSVDAMTEKQLCECMKSRASRTVDEKQLDNINDAIRKVTMAKIGDARLEFERPLYWSSGKFWIS